MDQVFETHTLPEIRAKYVELGIERNSFRSQSLSTLGAAYPEMLDLCSKISGLVTAATEHETSLASLSSVEKLAKWRRIAANTGDYHTRTTQDAQRHELVKLVAWARAQVDRYVAEGAILDASRLCYLLSLLDETLGPSSRLDQYLDTWLEKPSDNLDSIVAYILRHQISPSTVAERLAHHRLAQLPQVPVSEGIQLMEHTKTSLQYIADYELKLKTSGAKLVDSIDIDVSILPQHVLDAPLYPECFSQSGSFDKTQFVSEAESALAEGIKEFAKTAQGDEVISMYSLLVRDAPQLVAAAHPALVHRIESLVESSVQSISVLEVPEITESSTLLDLSNIDTIVLQVRGQQGPLQQSLELVYGWHETLAETRRQIEAIESLVSRAPVLKDVSRKYLSKLESESQEAIRVQIERVSQSPNYGAAVVVASALDPASKALQGLYSRVNDDLVAQWTLDITKTRLDGFPSTGLLRSLSRLVESMDSVVAGFNWTEEACVDIRTKAAEKLSKEFTSEMPFVCELFGIEYKQEEQAPKEDKPADVNPKATKKNKKKKKAAEATEPAAEAKEPAAEEAEAEQSPQVPKAVPEIPKESDASTPTPLTAAPITSAVSRIRVLLAPLASVAQS